MEKSYNYYGNGWYQLSDGTFAKRSGSITYLCPAFENDDAGNKRKKEELDDILGLKKCVKKVRVFNWRRK